MRSRLWIAGVAVLALFSGTAAATPVNETIDIAFGGGANLNIVFSGNTGPDEVLTHPFPTEVDNTFVATYTEAGPLNGATWAGLFDPFAPPFAPQGDLSSLLFDNAAGELIALFAEQALDPFDPFAPRFRLTVGTSVSDPANRAEITDIFGNLLAFAPVPVTQNVPAPGSLALLGLGLLVLRGARRS